MASENPNVEIVVKENGSAELSGGKEEMETSDLSKALESLVGNEVGKDEDERESKGGFS